MVPKRTFRSWLIEDEDEDVQNFITTVHSHDDDDWLRFMPQLIRLRKLTIVILYTGVLYPIPDQITHLTLRGLNNHPPLLPGVLPPKLHTLEFGRKYDMPLLPGVLPPNLHTLVLGPDFNQPIGPDVLPRTLHTLVFGLRFNQPLVGENVLPSELHHLTIHSFYTHPFTDQMISLPEFFFSEPPTHTYKSWLLKRRRDSLRCMTVHTHTTRER